MCAFSATLTTTAHSPQQLAVVCNLPLRGRSRRTYLHHRCSTASSSIRLHRSLLQRSWHTVVRVTDQPPVREPFPPADPASHLGRHRPTRLPWRHQVLVD